MIGVEHGGVLGGGHGGAAEEPGRALKRRRAGEVAKHPGSSPSSRGWLPGEIGMERGALDGVGSRHLDRGGLGRGSRRHSRGSGRRTSRGRDGGTDRGSSGVVLRLLLLVMCRGDVQRVEGKLRHGRRRHDCGSGSRLLLDLLKVLTEQPLLVLGVDSRAKDGGRGSGNAVLRGDQSSQALLRAGDVQGGYGASSGSCRSRAASPGYLIVHLLAPLSGLHNEALLLFPEVSVVGQLLVLGRGFRFPLRMQRPCHVWGTPTGRLFLFLELPFGPLVGEPRAGDAHHLPVLVLVDVLYLVLAQVPVGLHEGGGAGHGDGLVGGVRDATLGGVDEGRGARLVD